MIAIMSKLSEKSASGTPRPVLEALGSALLLALRHSRPQALSLHDSTGEALWLSGGSIGPDEHSLALTALEVFALELQRSSIHRKLNDGRSALYLAARDPLGGCSGLAFALLEDGPVDEARVVTPPIRVLLQRFSMLLAPRVEKRPHPAAAAPESDSTVDLPDGTPIRARAYTRLQPGSGTRRYELTLAGVGAQQDAAVFERVIDWLTQHRQRYLAKPSSFAIPISAAAAIDPEFAQHVGSCLSLNELEEGLAMLMLPAAAWAGQPARVLPLLDVCERWHCHVILDDFVVNDAALQLLRHKSIRMLKLNADLTAAAMLERYPRALLSACTQIARVLGIHCIAKRVATAGARRWLATAGIDYVDPFNPAEADAAADFLAVTSCSGRGNG